MKMLDCPKCGQGLIRLEPILDEGIYEYWCDDCNIDISIVDNNEYEKSEKENY